jgi:hypothetical protein
MELYPKDFDEQTDLVFFLTEYGQFDKASSAQRRLAYAWHNHQAAPVELINNALAELKLIKFEVSYLFDGDNRAKSIQRVIDKLQTVLDRG